MNLNSTERNPIYPKALRFCDVHDGAKYRIADASNGKIVQKGVFTGEPLILSTSLLLATVKTYSTKTKAEIHLFDMGITGLRYGEGKTNCYSHDYFTIGSTFIERIGYQTWLLFGGRKKLKAASRYTEEEEEEE